MPSYKVTSKTKVWSPTLSKEVSKVHIVKYRRYSKKNKKYEASDILRLYLNSHFKIE